MSRLSLNFFLTFVIALVLCALSVTAAPAASISASKGMRTGTASFFNVGLGHCGKKNKNSDFIVALATGTYAKGAHCDKKIQIKYKGKTAVATVRDSCPSCGANDLDMSPSLFAHFEKKSKGIFKMSWKFL